MPGAPVCGAPLAADSTSRFWPRGSRPASLMKSAIVSCPIVVGAEEPARIAPTVPSEPIVTEVAFAGTVIAGCTW